MRRREISPEFWTDEKVVQLSDPAKLLFIGLWNMADREGRVECKPKTIGFKIRPWAPGEVPVLLDELITFDLVKRYQVGGAEVLSIPKFAEHQRIHPKEMASRLPPEVITSEPTGKDPGETRLAGEGSEIMPLPALPAGSSLPSGPSGSSGDPERVDPAAAESAQGFFAWAQDQRHRVAGLVREKPPHPREVSVWFNQAQLETNGAVDRLQAGYLAFLGDAYWRNESRLKCPWKGWVNQWRDFMPSTAGPVAARRNTRSPVAAEAVDWSQVKPGEVAL